MLMLKAMLEQETDTRIVIMSATLDAELFSNYFPLCKVIDTNRSPPFHPVIYFSYFPSPFQMYFSLIFISEIGNTKKF